MAEKLTNEQQAAVDSRERSLLVSAAAGSGKTAVLVARIIRQVLEGGVDVDKLLVMTFTDAAAREMRQRVEAALEKALAAAVAEFNKSYPGVSFKAEGEGWTMLVPQKYEIGHEAHFSQVMNMYLGWMKKGEQPADYLPNMLVKYYTLAEAWKASR